MTSQPAPRVSPAMCSRSVSRPSHRRSLFTPSASWQWAAAG